jgi:hypothetical protein
LSSGSLSVKPAQTKAIIGAFMEMEDETRCDHAE